MIKQYGYPPAKSECLEVSSPGFVAEMGLDSLNAGSPLVEELLGARVPPASIARQILREFPSRAVQIDVSGYGTFRVSEKGWCVE